MGAVCSRRHRRNINNAEAPQQQQAPTTTHYMYPFPQRDPYPQRGGHRDTFIPFSQYPQAVQHIGNRGMPPTHAHQAPRRGQNTNELHQTKTIRNRVNLKKPSLKIVQMKDNENKLIPRFVFDASSPCSVTVFYMAQEDVAKKSKLTTIMQDPGPRAMYNTGLGQVFPPEGKEDEYMLDLSLYMEEDLTRVNGDVTFPLIIRLETITESSTDSHSLNQLKPGCPTPTWVQSQTTYAYLIKEDNEWEVRPVKQKIWVDGISYELQEIYGMQEFYSNEKKAADKVDTIADDIEGGECVICLAAMRDTTVLPCRHMCMCADCAQELQRQQVSTCPICRDTIDSLLRITRPEKKSHEASGEKSEKSTEAVKSTGAVKEAVKSA